jgi:hypothetical protein
MDLAFENGKLIRDPDDGAIADGLTTLGPKNSFAILSRGAMTYIQTSGKPQEGFVLEYQEGTTKEHYRCTDEMLPVDRVISAFQKFSRDDSSYKQEFEWTRAKAGGCLAVAIFLPLAAAGAGCAAGILV